MPCLLYQEIIMLSVKTGINSGVARMGVREDRELRFDWAAQLQTCELTLAILPVKKDKRKNQWKI